LAELTEGSCDDAADMCFERPLRGKAIYC